MKFELKAVDRKRGVYSRNISNKELSALHSLYFMLLNEGGWIEEILRWGGIDKEIKKFFKTVVHFCNDVMHDGTATSFENGKSVRHPQSYYMLKKPKWRKIK